MWEDLRHPSPGRLWSRAGAASRRSGLVAPHGRPQSRCPVSVQLSREATRPRPRGRRSREAAGAASCYHNPEPWGSMRQERPAHTAVFAPLGKSAEECHVRRVPGNEGGPLSFSDPAASAPSIRAGTGWHWRRRRRHPGAWPQNNHWDSNKGNTGPGGRERGSGKEEPLPEGIDLCAHFDPATIFMCFSHILFTAPLSERCFKLDGAREGLPPSPPVPAHRLWPSVSARCTITPCSRVTVD